MTLLRLYLASSENTDLSFPGKTMDIRVRCWIFFYER